MSDYRFTSDETLVFRDGRPFGDAGAVRGGFLSWPLPSTLTGMVRSRAGLVQSDDFFTVNGNRDKILQVGINNVWPCYRKHGEDTWHWLHPAPADVAILSDGKTEFLTANSASYEALPEGVGTDLELPRGWLLPVWPDNRSKPASNTPRFWFWENYQRYLSGKGNWTSTTREALGLTGPTPDCRIHSAIDAEMLTAKDGALFLSQGVRLASKREVDGEMEIVDYGFALSADGVEKIGSKSALQGWVHLGGERKMGQLLPLDVGFPECPDPGPQKYLRLILQTPGQFGDWKPEDLEVDKFTTPHGCPSPIKLVGACLPTWQPASGWDFKTRADKPMRKMVPAGAVYVIELENPAHAPAVAKAFWGSSLCLPDYAKEGFGLVTVGQVTVKPS